MRLIRLLSFVVASALLLAACTSPDSTPPPTGGTPDIGSGVVGTVLTRDGAPAANQAVTFHAAGVLPADLGPASSFETLTGSTGEYGVELPAGTYNAVALRGSDGASGWKLTVRAGEVTEAPELRMLPLGQVNGRALYPDRDDHIGITISVPGTSFVATSNAEGNFSMRLPAGTYDLTAFQATYGHASRSNVTINSGETTTLSAPLALTDLGPQISSVSPSVAIVGERIEITGANFGDIPGSIQFGNERYEFGDFWADEGEEPFLWSDTRLVIAAYDPTPLTIIRVDGKHATVPDDGLLILGPPELLAVGSFEDCEYDSEAPGGIACGEQRRRVPGIWAREALEVQPGEVAHISITARLAEYGAFLEGADPDRDWRTVADQELSLEVSETYSYCHEADDCGDRFGWLFGVTVGSSLEPVEFLEVNPGLTDADGYATVTASVVIPDGLAYFTVRLVVNGGHTFAGWVGIEPLALYVIPEGADLESN